MGKRRRPAETAEAQAVAALFDAMIAKRRAEAQQAQRETVAELNAMRQAIMQKLQSRSRAEKC